MRVKRGQKRKSPGRKDSKHLSSKDRPDVEALQRNVRIQNAAGFLNIDIDARQHSDLSIVEEAARRLH